MQDYRLTFPDIVQSISLTKNDLGDFADITTGGKAPGMNIQIEYFSDQKTGTFSADVPNGEYRGSKLTTSLSKTYSFDGKNPVGATKVHAELKLHLGFFSGLFVSDESARYGLEQAIDKIGERAKVIQQSSGNSQLVTTSTTPNTPPTQTPINKPVTPPPVTTTIPVPKPTPIPPVIAPQPTSPTVQPSITVKTDLTSYKSGDDIIIIGLVQGTYEKNNIVGLSIRNPNGDVAYTNQIPISTNGDYTTKVVTNGNLWKVSGTYVVDAQYFSKGISSETTFYFNAQTPSPIITTPTSSPKLPTITLYSSSVNGMTATIYGNAQSGTGKSLDNISLNWGDGQSSTGQFPQAHTYSQSGTYTVTVSVIDSGLSSSATTSVIISTPQPTTPSQPAQQIQPQPTVTVKTDLSSYKTGDTIVITGHVTNLNSASAITIRIVNPDQNLVLVTQIVPSSDGSFTTTVSANGSLWQPSGTFTVIAQYGSANTISQTTFNFTYVPIQSNPATSNTQPSGTPIGDTDYKVSAGTYTPIPFTLSCSASVSGTFSSTAGLGNDIMVFIFDQNNLQKFTSNSYTAYYESGKVATGSFNLNMTPGTYYIVLSNLYSSFSTKNVHIQATYTCN